MIPLSHNLLFLTIVIVLDAPHLAQHALPTYSSSGRQPGVQQSRLCCTCAADLPDPRVRLPYHPTQSSKHVVADPIMKLHKLANKSGRRRSTSTPSQWHQKVLIFSHVPDLIHKGPTKTLNPRIPSQFSVQGVAGTT